MSLYVKIFISYDVAGYAYMIWNAAACNKIQNLAIVSIKYTIIKEYYSKYTLT